MLMEAEKWNKLVQEQYAWIPELEEYYRQFIGEGGLALPIDEGIKPILTRLWALNYKTFMSCQGHSEKSSVSGHEEAYVAVIVPVDNIARFLKGLKLLMRATSRHPEINQKYGHWTVAITVPNSGTLPGSASAAALVKMGFASAHISCFAEGETNENSPPPGYALVSVYVQARSLVRDPDAFYKKTMQFVYTRIDRMITGRSNNTDKVVIK